MRLKSSHLITLLITFMLIIVGSHDCLGIEYSETVPFVYRLDVFISDAAEPGGWVVIEVRLRSLHPGRMRFAVDVNVHYGWGRWSNWSTLIDRELRFNEAVNATHSVRIPVDVETGAVLVWVNVQYTNANYYCREGPREYYVSANYVFTGPYVVGTTPELP